MILSICIPVFNKSLFTKECLNDLSHLPDNHEIIIIDNASTDNTKDIVATFPRIKYIENKTNEGFAKACNKGFANSTSNNVMFLNNDIKVIKNKESWTKNIIEKCNLGLIGPTMGLLDKNLSFVKEANEKLTGNSYMSGWCLSSSKEIWNKLKVKNQIFSEDFFCYFEDTDLSFRARKLNIPMHVVDIPVHHYGKQSSKQLNTHTLYTKARATFIKKWS